MSEAKAPERMLDPICEMVVEVVEARAGGRTVEYDERTYAFCSNGCVEAFTADPVRWAAKADAASTVRTVTGEAVVDEGMRRSYADAYPAIVTQLAPEPAAATV